MILEHTERIGVSIVIVTFNGKNRLEEVLKGIARQNISGLQCELLVIDNNSTDQTEAYTIQKWSKLGNPFPLIVKNEPRAGTMHARKTGILEAQYRYMLFCDDDNILRADYIKTAFNTITKNKTIAAVGGEGVINYNNFEPPLWMTETYERSYGCGSQGKSDGDTTHDKGCLYTAGTIIDRWWMSSLYQSGFKSVLKGRDGKTLLAGEDTELTMALKLIGAELHYNSNMKFDHVMTSNRITWSYLKQLWKSFGYSNYIISPYGNHINKRDSKYTFQLVNTARQIVMLKVKIIKGSFAVGSIEILEYEKLKGKLKAMIFSHSKYIETNRTIERILAFMNCKV